MTRLRLLIVAALVGALALAPAAFGAYAFQGAWGSQGSGQGQFGGVLYLAVGPDGSVYVVDDAGSRVEKFTADGAFVTTWGAQGSGPGQFGNPQGVAVGPDGSVYVTDTGNNRVERFDANGGFLSQWGTPGSLDGQFQTPIGVAAGPDGSVYVADNGNRRVERFLADGTFLSSFASGAGGFSSIAGVATGPDGSVYVVDTGNKRVEHLDASGTFLGAWGSGGSGDGQFQSPSGVAASAAGVYVADSTQNRVQHFDASGTFIDALDPTNSGDPQLADPVGVAAGAGGDVYVSQPAGERVSHFVATSSGGSGGSLPPPQTGVSANAVPISGTVKVKRPGSRTFELLTAAAQIPIGSIVDVSAGTVGLTTTKSARTTQTAQFYGGLFKLLQDKSKAPVTTLNLFGGDFAHSCGAAGAAHAATTKSVRHLWGRGKARFRTRGRYASATVRGTQWLTDDRCDGTLVRVKQGAVTVRDLVRKVEVLVKAPRSYFAPRKSLRKR